jgi:hypothetical protein
VEEGKQQETVLQDQPSSSWSDVGAETEGQPRVSLPGSGDEQGEQGLNFNTPQSSVHSSSSSSLSSIPPLRRVSTDPNPQVSAVANPIMSTNTVKIGGEKIVLSATENLMQDVPKAFWKKQDRMSMPQKEHLELISRATQ